LNCVLCTCVCVYVRVCMLVRALGELTNAKDTQHTIVSIFQKNLPFDLQSSPSPSNTFPCSFVLSLAASRDRNPE